MSTDPKIETIAQVYEAFGRGDVAAILEAVTDDVDWASDTASKAAPWYGIHHGKDGVMDFFRAFGTEMEVLEFTPVSYAANDTEVHTLVRHRSTSRSTGKSVDMDLHHYFRFRDGKIEFYRGSEDSAQTEAALSS
jgi:ketosteroid isomerase-like protein